MKRKTTEEFIKEAIDIHGDKYDYSSVEYINARSTVKIICPIHGSFNQLAKTHLGGYGCYDCGIKSIKKTLTKTTEEFIKEAIDIHGNKYDYSKTQYSHSKLNIKIICPIHGEFSQRASHHLEGNGCKKCNSRLKNTNQFIQKAIDVHGDKYNYSLVEYINSRSNVKIICSIHGKFIQKANSHLQGRGCLKCGLNKKTKEQFIQEAIDIHENKYDYSLINYHDTKQKIEIICKNHGSFFQTPMSHLAGRGCPRCYFDRRYSKSSIQWLNQIMENENIFIQHAENEGEFVFLSNSKTRADGYCKETNTIYEFYGDFWHGNPIKFNPDEVNEITNTTYGELYQKTIERENKIKELGYNLVTIWESDFK
jgi:hypothetical protein